MPYWRRSLPQPDIGHAERMQALRDLEREFPGLAMAGNYVAGVSTANCIDTAVAVGRPYRTVRVLAERHIALAGDTRHNERLEREPLPSIRGGQSQQQPQLSSPPSAAFAAPAKGSALPQPSKMP